MRSTRYTNALSKEEETQTIAVFDAWLEGQPQETKEIVRLHIFNVRAAFSPRNVAFGEQSAKLLVAAIYLQVRKFDTGARL